MLEAPTIETKCPDSRRALRTLFLCAVGLVLFLRLQAIWPVGFYQDDSVMNLWGTEARLSGKSVYGHAHVVMKSMMIYQGRFKPAACYLILPIDLAIGENRVLFRVCQALAQAAALGAIALLCARLSGNRHYWGLVLVLFVSFYELRDYHDSAFGQFIFIPAVMIFGSLACYFAVRCATRESSTFNADLGLAVLFSSLGLLTMEFALPFCGVACLFMLSGKAPGLRRAFRFLIASLPVILINAFDMYLRRTSTYAGTAVGDLSLSAIWHTYFGQLVSAMPLSYLHYDPQHLFADNWNWTGDTLAAGGGGLAAAAAIFMSCSDRRPRHFVLLLVLGVTLFLLPSLMIAPSLKYQRETSPGMGYLQTVFSYLGASLLLSLLISWLAERLDRRRWLLNLLRVGSATAVGLVFAVTLLCAQRVVQATNSQWRFPREMTDVWLRATKPAPNVEEHFVVDHEWLNRWENRSYLFAQRGTIGTFTTSANFKAEPPALAPNTMIVRLRYPDRAAATDLFLVVGSFARLGSTEPARLSAFVISADRAKLEKSNLKLQGPDAARPFPVPAAAGARGYYYRQLELTVPSPSLDGYSLLIQ